MPVTTPPMMIVCKALILAIIVKVETLALETSVQKRFVSCCREGFSSSARVVNLIP